MITIKELKQDNKNALRYLHNGFGLDFQQPFTVVKHDGKFTAKSIINCLSKEIDHFSAEDYEIVLLIRHYDYNGKLERQHAAVFDGEKFYIDVPRGYNDDIDTFYDKGDLEHTRKNKTAYLFVIAQKKEYLIDKPSTYPDLTVRYRYIPTSYEKAGDGNGNIYYSRVHIKEMHKNIDPFEWDIRYRRYKSLSEIIDKSGYLTAEYRNKLMNRVRAYKSHKRKNEFLATDYSETVKELDGIFDGLKTEIAITVKNITTYSQARLLEKAVDNFAWGLSYFTTYRKRIAEKEYDSKQHAESAEQNIRSYLDKVYEALRGAANETDGK